MHNLSMKKKARGDRGVFFLSSHKMPSIFGDCFLFSFSFFSLSLSLSLSLSPLTLNFLSISPPHSWVKVAPARTAAETAKKDRQALRRSVNKWGRGQEKGEKSSLLLGVFTILTSFPFLFILFRPFFIFYSSHILFLILAHSSSFHSPPFLSSG